MMLGQPETPDEIRAEQWRLIRRSQARKARDEQITRNVRAAVANGQDLATVCLRTARAERLGKGGAQYVRQLAERP